MAKTSLATTLPKYMWPVLMVNIDAGGEDLSSVFKAHKVLPVLDDGVLLPDGPPTDDNPWNMISLTLPVGDPDLDIWDWVSEVLEWPDWTQRLGIRTLVFDGISTFGKYLLSAVADTQQFVSEKQQKEGKGTPSVGVRNKLHQPDQGTYGLTQSAMTKLRVMMFSQPWNVVGVAHQTFRVDNTPAGQETIAGADLPGRAIIQTFAAEWSQVVHVKAGIPTAKNGVSTQSMKAVVAYDGRWPARARSDAGQVGFTEWPMRFDHEVFWDRLASEVGVEFWHGHDPATEAYNEMPVGANLDQGE